MVMADRDEVGTAPLAVAAIDTVLLAQQMAAALARVPFKAPLQGDDNAMHRLGATVTREVVRSFMGYLSSLPLEEFRSVEKVLDKTCQLVMPPVVSAFGVTSRKVVLSGVKGIIYRPNDVDAQGVILYLHGGGYIGTSPSMYAFFTAHLCRATQCAVFVADYRLAPEFPFPAGLIDAGHVLAGLVRQGVPRGRLLVAGDSGGGGLANALVLAAVGHEELERPAGLLVFSPEVDLRLDEPSVTDNAKRDILPWNIPTASYLHGADASSEYISGIDADLDGFPPTFVCWGADEMFRDPIRRYVERLDEAGVPNVAHEAPGMFHVFPILMPWADRGREAIAEAAGFVRAILDDAPPMRGEAAEALRV